MKKYFVIPASLSLLFLVFMTGLALAEEAPQLLKLKHTVLSPTSEQVVLQLNGSYSPKIFTIKDQSPRVIFDFADMTHSREVKSITTSNGAIVKRVRVGMHTDDAPKTRIVFDVATLKGVTYSQEFDDKTSTLTVRFIRPEKAVESKKVVPQDKPAPEPATTTNAPDDQKSQAAVEAAQPPTSAETTVTKPPEPPPAEAKPTEQAPVETQPPAAKGAMEQKEAAAPQPLAPAVQPPPSAAPATTPPPPATPSPAEKPPVAAEHKTGEPATPAPVKQQTNGDAPPAVQPKPPKASEPAQVKPAEEKTAKDGPPAPATERAPEENKASAAAPKEVEAPKQAPAPQSAAPAATAKTEDATKTATAQGAVPAKTDEEPRLESVRFDASSPKGEMILFKLNGFHPPAVHGVEEGIPRVVCDFNNTKLIDSVSKVIKADGRFVKVIRTSKTKKPEKARVVIDLEPNRSYDLQQVFFKEDNLFVIIVNTVKK
jgi:hypothetical protein